MKFFRTTRKNALSKQNVINYIGYAIGEIILVVVGILIAVSINNRNEEKQSQKELSNIYLTVKEDLENDIQEIDKVLGYYDKTILKYNRILKDSVTKADYKNDPMLKFLILGYPEISFDTRGFNLLSEYNSSTESSTDTLLLNIIDFYTERLLEIKVDDDLRASDFTENIKYWKNNYDWWADYIYNKESDKFIAYALTDQDYKNRVANAYFLTYDVFLPELKTFKKRALSIINSIEGRGSQ